MRTLLLLLGVTVALMSAKQLTVLCPGGIWVCPSGNTCCPENNGQYGCCPMTNAVCCSDQQHCCPSGYRCDATGLKCNRQNEATIPSMQKLAAISMV
ncbi:unnamed protein product, partial [Mesorhabditis belari]|uniref:Granulins domain-containing protein n=1 Tax=Mesorhabditis belari TaxID=2138241 RepID=A0AAF3FA78_9BILA